MMPEFRVEIQDAAGAWQEVRELGDLTLRQHQPDPRVEERIRTTSSLSLEFAAQDGEGLLDLINRLEREQILTRWRARAWLTHPYRTVSAR